MRRTRWWSLLMLVVWTLTACAQFPWQAASPTPVAEDVWPPVVSAYQPADGQEVPLDATVMIRFDQPMDRKRTEAAFSLEPATNGTFIWQDVRTLMFRPRALLQPATTYRVRLESSARALSGEALQRPLDFTFITQAPAQVTQIYPPHGATDLRVDSALLIGFNRAIVPESCLGEVAGNRAECPVLPAAVTPAVLTRGMWLAPALYRLSPYPGWNAGTTYTLTLNGTLTTFDANPVQLNMTSRFSVASPQVVRIEPLDRQTAALPPDTTLRITFNHPMDPQATAEAFSLTQTDGTPVPGLLTWEADDTVLVFKPLQPLALATRYVVRLSNRARTVTTAPLPQSHQWIFETIPVPMVSVVYPPNGAKDVQPVSSVRFALQGVWDEATLRSGLIISPTVQNFNVVYQAGALAVNWERAPRTTYCVELPAGLEDLYGQVLAQRAKTCFSTADLPATFEPILAGDTLLIDANAVARVTFLARNVARVSFQLYRVDEQSFMTNAPVSGTPLRDWVERFTVTDPNAVQVLTIDVMRGNPLRSGYYQLQWNDPTDGQLRRVRLAVVDRHLNILLGREEAQVWVSDLRTTAPITGVQVRLLEQGVLLAAGTTNAEGLVQLRFEPRSEIYTELFAVTGEPGSAGFGLVSTAWGHNVAPWDFGLPAQYEAFPTYTLWAFTDKQRYRPQESIAFAGLARLRNDALYELPQKLTRLQVTLTPVQGQAPVYSDTVRVSPQGNFEGFIPLLRSVAPGRYTLRIGETNGPSFWQDELHILPLLPGNEAFEIRALSTQRDLPLFTPVTLTLYAVYPNGTPVINASGKLSVWRKDKDATQPFAEIPLHTDAQGQLAFALPQPTPLPSEPEEWLLSVTLKDPEGHEATHATLVQVHPTPVYPEVRLSTQVGRMRQTVNVQVRAVAWDQTPVSGIPLTVTLVRRTWSAPVAITPYLSDAWQHQESIDDTKALTSGTNWLNVSLFPPTSGDYVVRVSGGITRELTLKVTGSDAGSWRQSAAQLVPTTDKPGYRAGETAQLLLPLATAQPCRVLMSVVRNGVILRRFYDFAETTPVVSLPISQEFVPGVYVVFTAFCPGPEPEVKSGTVYLPVQPVLQTLRLTIDTERTTYAPQETVTLKLRVSDAGDRPVENAQVWVAVTEHLPDQPLFNTLMDTFYTHPLRLIGGDTAHVLMERWKPLWQTLDPSAAATWLQMRVPTPQVRTVPEWPEGSLSTSQRVLLWQPALTTDAAGEVQVSFQLPPEVGEWRVRAFAAFGPMQMGEAQLSLSSSEPIRLLPQLPTTLHAGDLITLGVKADNLTLTPLTPTLALMVEGATLLTTPVTTLSLPAQSTAVYTWALRVPQAGIGNVILHYEARLPSAPAVAVTRTLPVQALQSIPYPVLIGALRDEASWRGSFYVPSQAEAGSALQLNLYPSLTHWLEAQAARLTNENDADTEAVALRLLTLTSVKGDKQAAVQTLYRYQNKDGGWGAWAGDKNSTLHESALAIWALAEAQAAGQTIDADVLNNGLEYISKTLAQNLAGDKSCTPEQALGFLALAVARYRWPQETPQLLYTCRQSLGVTGQAYLALALGQIDPADTRLKMLLSGLSNAARADGTWYEMDASYRITPERATAISLLALATLQPEHKLLPAALLQALAPTLPERERAWSVLALKRYLDARPETAANSSTWEVWLNGTAVTTYRSEQGALQLTLPLAQLKPDATQTIALQRTGGEGTVYYEAYLTLDLPVTRFTGGMQLERLYCRPRPDYATLCEAMTRLPIGEEIEVRLRLTVPVTRTRVLLSDTFPAGMMLYREGVYGALNPFKHTAFGSSGVQFYAPLIPPGTYEVRYRLRAVYPGRFGALPASLRELYLGTLGRSEEGWLEVVP